MIQIVRQDVHGEGGHRDVHLATHVTLLGVVRVQTPVGLLVAGQVGASGVVLSTLTAHVLGFVLGALQAVPVLLGPAVGDGQRVRGGGKLLRGRRGWRRQIQRGRSRF